MVLMPDHGRHTLKKENGVYVIVKDAKANQREQSRAEHSRAEQSRAEQIIFYYIIQKESLLLVVPLEASFRD